MADLRSFRTCLDALGGASEHYTQRTSLYRNTFAHALAEGDMALCERVAWTTLIYDEPSNQSGSERHHVEGFVLSASEEIPLEARLERARLLQSWLEVEQVSDVVKEAAIVALRDAQPQPGSATEQWAIALLKARAAELFRAKDALLASTIEAVGCCMESFDLDLVRPFAAHPDPRVRYDVLYAVSQLGDEEDRPLFERAEGDHERAYGERSPHDAAHEFWPTFAMRRRTWPTGDEEE